MITLRTSLGLSLCHALSLAHAALNGILNQHPLVDTISTLDTPTPTLTVQGTVCTPTNIIPKDLPTYKHFASNDGVYYDVKNASGLIQNWQSPYSLQGVVFGPNGPDANKWTECITPCSHWCDSHSNCHSFNIFTFQEDDYEHCQVTCECRAVRRPFTQVDYEEYDPSWPSLVWTQNVYCFNDTCCYDPEADAFNPCLWQAANVKDFIENFYKNYPRVGGNGIISDIMNSVFQRKYTCDITGPQKCPLDFDSPDTTDPEKITAFLAFAALRRYMLYMAGNRLYTSSSFNQLIGDDVEEIVTLLTGSNTKEPATDRWSEISSGLAIAAACAALVAAPETEVAAVIWWDLSSMLGLGTGIGSLLDFMQPSGPATTRVNGLPEYLRGIATNLTHLIDARAKLFVSNATYAAQLLDTQLGGTALNLTTDTSWIDAAIGITNTQALLRSWTISQVFEALGIFIHWENGCSHTYDYDGQQCYTPNGTNTQVYAFPVYYVVGDSPHQTREYDVAHELTDTFKINWRDVFTASHRCQYIVHDFSDFGTSAFPQMDPQALVNALQADPARDPETIDCLWNLPVCDASQQKGQVADCVDSQPCCTGHCGDDDNGGWGGWFFGRKDHVNDDNFPMDDWCARKLGSVGLEASGKWDRGKPYESPFQDCPHEWC